MYQIEESKRVENLAALQVIKPDYKICWEEIARNTIRLFRAIGLSFLKSPSKRSDIGA